MTVIKKGYRITVVSWENDGDNYRTITKDGYDECETKLIVDLMKLLESRCFGNMYEPNTDKLYRFEGALRVVFDKHGVDYTEGGEFSVTDYAMDAYIGEFTGYGSEFFTRVVQSISVEYIPQDIVIENVSDKFGLVYHSPFVNHDQ